MGYTLGQDCKLYRCATALDAVANTPALATWIEMDNVRDLTVNLAKGETDITTRANDGWRAMASTLKDGSLDFESLWDTDDAAFAALLSAYLNNTLIALAAMDGDIAVAGAEGLSANFSVTNISRSEPLEEGVMASVTVKPSTIIAWYEAAGS